MFGTNATEWVAINNWHQHICSGTTGQVDLPSSIMRPHSWLLSQSITRSASHERLVVCEIIEYVLIQMQQPAEQRQGYSRAEVQQLVINRQRMKIISNLMW